MSKIILGIKPHMKFMTQYFAPFETFRLLQMRLNVMLSGRTEKTKERAGGTEQIIYNRDRLKN